MAPSTTPDLYRDAFIRYLRKGTSIELTLKALKETHPSKLYIWRTRGDANVRPSHAANNGKVFSWDSRPTTGHPGEDYGCRCIAEAFSIKEPMVIAESTSRVVTYFPDGSSNVREGGSRSWRNNNPSNIRSGQFSKLHGAIGDAGGFAVFPNEKIGQDASVALLRTSNYINLTIDQAIARRSPSTENDTARLQALIRKIGGFSGKEIISSLNDTQMRNLAMSIQRTEGWIEGNIIHRSAPS